MSTRLPTLWQRLITRLNQPVPLDSLAAFRVLFGFMGLFGALRFLANGWTQQLYLKPNFFFTYWGLDWIQPWPGNGMYVHFALLALLSGLICVGLFYRLAITLYFFAFTYVELLDKSNYLNHYYFISLVALLLIFMPAHRKFSLDVAWGRIEAQHFMPQAILDLLRLQLVIVYFFAGLAKLNADWLFRAEPLSTWLTARNGLPIIGPLLGTKWLAYAMSWTGALFDLSIGFLLLNRRFRAYAYCLVVVFHGATGKLFYIGLFPWIMIASTLLFFEADWPRRLKARITKNASSLPSKGQSPYNPRLSRPLLATMFVYLTIQVALPLRQHLYPGNVAWTEQGYRFAWNVMRAEKTGQVDFVIKAANGKQWRVNPRDHLTTVQLKMMGTQPDMILQFAHYLADSYQQEGYKDVQVYADAWAALNGHPRARLIDPTIDLAQKQQSFKHQEWILHLQ